MAKDETTNPLWRINYTYVNSKAQIRAGAVVIQAATIQEANQIAGKMLAGLAHHRITATKEY